MTEIELNDADKKRIKEDIKLTLILGLLFTIIVIGFFFVIGCIMFFVGNPTEGFVYRGLTIIAVFSLPMLAISWKNIIKYIDLKKGKKINFRTTDFEIKKEKENYILRTTTPLKLKFDLYDKLPDLIKPKEPITIESTKWSKTLLYISQDNENLLEKVEKEDE